jgi:hypothetical protein
MPKIHQSWFFEHVIVYKLIDFCVVVIVCCLNLLLDAYIVIVDNDFTRKFFVYLKKIVEYCIAICIS